MKNRSTLSFAAICLALSGPTAAEYVVTARTIELTPELAEIREHQEKLGETENVTIYAADREYQSGTGLYGLPESLKGMVIKGTEDLPALVERLYDFYGRLGEETLEIGPVYPENIKGYKVFTLYEYVAGLETTQKIEIEVDKATGELRSIGGWYYYDQDLEREPKLSKEDAIRDLVDAVRRASIYEYKYDPIPTYEGNHKARVIYGSWGDGYGEFWVPMWLIELDTRDVTKDEPVAYLVSPYGRVNHARDFLSK